MLNVLPVAALFPPVAVLRLTVGASVPSPFLAGDKSVLARRSMLRFLEGCLQ
ncbi:MAG: hypothetical protein SW833_08665 [Cyanobacteriota bacterium]|nr:hypothetical protein [Cyanobacteriota bacterium]